MKNNNLCTDRDYFLEEKCTWVIKLNDGTFIYQDDDRPGIEPTSAWIRLKKYLSENRDKKIVQLKLKFGTNEVHVADNKDIYFYSHGMIASINGLSKEYHIVGWNIDDGEIVRTHYSSPELLISNRDKRSIDDCKENQLIINNK